VKNMQSLGSLITEARNPHSDHIDELSTLEMLTVINQEDATVAAAVASQLPEIARAVDTIVARFAPGGRLFYIGAGTSGRPGRARRLRVPAHLLRPAGTGARSDRRRRGCSPPFLRAQRRFTGRRREATWLPLASASPTPLIPVRPDTRYTRRHRRQRTHSLRARRVAARAQAEGLHHRPGLRRRSPISKVADLTIAPLTGPEVITGSTRMKAGTATKLVLNMLSTGVMIRMGAVYGNLMVNVKPTNDKLIDRAHPHHHVSCRTR
jgi:N-acetylmuramic acid 6-phosphate etherase